MCQTHIGGVFSRTGMTGTGRLDDAVVRFLAANYALIVANGLEPGRPEQCMEVAIKDLADRVFDFNPNARTVMYQANVMVHSRQASLHPAGGRVETLLPCGLENLQRSMLATTDDGALYVQKSHAYFHNLSDPGMRQQWLGVITNKSLGSHVAGVFADNSIDTPPSGWLSDARGRALLKGQQDLLKEVVAAGKYVIFNGMRLNRQDDLDALATELPSASSGYFEPWLASPYRNLTTGKLDEAKATHALLKMINASVAMPDKGMTFKTGPGPCVGYIAGQDEGCTWPFANGSTAPVPNKMNGTPQTAAGRRAAAAKLITFPLASFLCAAGPKWHFDYSWGYSINDFVPGQGPNSTLAGQPNLESNAPDEWYPVLLKAPGTPRGACAYDAATSTFTREWTGVSVSLNMAEETATLEWKGAS
jgi:hypothetical protein